MEKGLILALCAAVIFSGGTVFMRRGVSQAGESFSGVIISVLIGVLFFAGSSSVSGEWGKLWFFSGQELVFLAAAGIIHFVGGRLLNFTAYRLIGANKASALIMTLPFYTLIFGITFLDEPVTIPLVFGVICIATGAVLASMERKSVGAEKQTVVSGTEFKGILAALGGALCWGTSPILVRAVVSETGSSSVAAFVSYATASVILACFLFRRQFRQQLVQVDSFAALMPLIGASMFMSIAQLLRYVALSYSQASMVTPLISTSSIFVLILSFFINRNIELFTVKVILGILATVMGTFLIFY